MTYYLRMRFRTAGTLAALVLFSLSVRPAVTPAADDNWPQWRGPGGLAVGSLADYPDTWSATEHIAWKTPIPGRGHSSPVVLGDRIYLTTSIEGAVVPGHKPPIHIGWDMKPGYLHPDSMGSDHAHTLKTMAIDARSGKVVWERTVYDGPMYDDRHRKNTYASPTAVTDGSMVYFFFESAGLFAFDVDGTLKWKVVDPIGIAKAGLGPGTSPVLFENLVIIQCDQGMGERGSYIAAYDKRTGKEVWRADRTNRRSWATPLLINANGRTELVASGAEAVIAYDPRTGKELWKSDGTKGHPIPSSAFGHGLVYAFAGNAENSKMVLAIQPGARAGTESRVKWRYTRGTAYVASPILYGDYLYLLTDSGITTCLDARTGEVKYQGGRVPVPASFTASPVAFGDKIFLTSEEGDTFVLRAGPTHEIIRTNSLDEPVLASPALANGMVYIRGDKHLYAIKR